jgi:hypothetical protein
VARASSPSFLRALPVENARTRAGAHKRSTLEAGMWLVGSCYNLLWVHRSLEEGCTPAMAAGLTDHRRTMEELLAFPVVPEELPPGAVGSLDGYWRPSVPPDHGSMWRYLCRISRSLVWFSITHEY